LLLLLLLLGSSWPYLQVPGLAYALHIMYNARKPAANCVAVAAVSPVHSE
jgi:hypothetical protein